MPFLTYRLQHRFELTTNTLMLKKLTQQYPTCSLTAFPAEKLTIPFCIGWGSAGNDQSRLRALKQSPSTGTTSTYIILEDNVMNRASFPVNIGLCAVMFQIKPDETQ